jgi:hypothetical protein
METSEPRGSGKHYVIGDVGAGARVMQGDYTTWLEERLSGVPESDELQRRFEALLERLSAASELDDDERELAVEKTAGVVEGLAAAPENPGRLKRALLDAKAFLTSGATWAWDELQAIVASDAAQKTIGTISEAGTRAAIASILGH